MINAAVYGIIDSIYCSFFVLINVCRIKMINKIQKKLKLTYKLNKRMEYKVKKHKNGGN